ncbi:MAG: hypothetical protein KIH65_002930 [Candidatus Uhrbacteria bacterium]|nr:hypothetical protein [Candidatus Uhrbacteria bacterium]
MHPQHLEYCKMNVAFAIYQHFPQGDEKKDWNAAERLLKKYPFALVRHEEELSYEAFQRAYGEAVYYHTLNHILFLRSKMI